MASDDKYNDRKAVDFDFRQVILDLQEFDLQVPSEGVFDDPVVYWRANIKWAKLIEGMIDWLSEPAVWGVDADENSTGVQGILRYLERWIPDMPIDCEEVENCLETSEIITTINDSIGGLSNGGFNPQNVNKPLSQSSSYPQNFQNDIFEPSSGCDDDDKNALWSIVSQLVDFLHAGNVAFIQASTSNFVSIPQGISNTISYIPLIGGLGSSLISNAFSWVLNYLKPNYESAVTVSFLRSVKCEIFCMAVDNGCVLNLADVLDLIAANAGASEPASSYTFTDLISELVGLSSSGSALFWQSTQLQIEVLGLGESFGSKKGLSAYIAQFQAGADSSDGAWQIYCEDCNEPPATWTLVFDFGNDYERVSDEIVIRNAASLWDGWDGQKYKSLAYHQGMRFFSTTGEPRYGRYRLVFANTPYVTELALSLRVNGLGYFTQTGAVGNNATSSNISMTETTFTEKYHAPDGAITTIAFTVSSPSSGLLLGADVNYFKVTGTGALPQF